MEYKEDIRFIGFVPDEQMSALYSAANVFAFPTLYEGFGIPVLEAQVCGTPVLTSKCTALPEVGGDAALYADPYSIEEIADNLERLMTDEKLRTELIQKDLLMKNAFLGKRLQQQLDEWIERNIAE